MKKTISAAIIAFVVWLFIGSKVSGQIGNPGLMYQGAFNNAMFLTTKSAIERGMKTAAAPNYRKSYPSTHVAAGMNFVSSAKVQDKVLKLIATIAANGNKDKAIAAAQTIRNANFMGYFDKLLRPYGLNRHNVPDVFTAFIMLSWQAINGKDVGQYREGIELFRKQIHSAMDNNRDLQALANDQKQEISEILSYMAVFFTYACQDQAKKRDTASLTATRQNIREAVIRVSGIDLTKYAVNNNGLVENR